MLSATCVVEIPFFMLGGIIDDGLAAHSAYLPSIIKVLEYDISYPRLNMVSTNSLNPAF